ADESPVQTVGQGEPPRLLGRPFRRPAADRTPSLRVARVEAPAVRLAVGARGPALGLLRARESEPRDQGDRSSSGTLSEGALRAQIHAAAEASSSASSVRNMKASGIRLAASAVPSWAAGDPEPLMPLVSPKP